LLAELKNNLGVLLVGTQDSRNAVTHVVRDRVTRILHMVENGSTFAEMINGMTMTSLRKIQDDLASMSNNKVEARYELLGKVLFRDLRQEMNAEISHLSSCNASLNVVVEFVMMSFFGTQAGVMSWTSLNTALGDAIVRLARQEGEVRERQNRDMGIDA
jgi:hypothetical protein